MDECYYPEGDTALTCATYEGWVSSMIALADTILTATDAIADAYWGEAVSDLVEGWNSISEEEPRVVMPRKVKLERRQVWQQRSKSLYHERIEQSRSRIAIHARKVARRQRHAAKTR